MDKRLLTGLILIQSLFFGIVSESHAVGVAVYPGKFELEATANQGKFISKSVTVENCSKKTVRVKSNAQHWKLDANGNIVYMEKPDEHSLVDNIRFNPSEFDIGPNQKQVVRFTVKVPDGPDGEYREILFFNTTSEKSTIISNLNKKFSIKINFESRFGTTIYLYKGIVTRNATITDLKIEKENKETYLTATLANSGNIHTTLAGKVVLENKSDPKKNTEISVKYHVFPECTQKMRIKIPDNFCVDKNNTAFLSLDYLDKDLKVQNIAAETDFSSINLIVPVNNPTGSADKKKIIPAVNKKPTNKR